MTPSSTKFLGIGVPPRPTACPQCRKAIEVDSFVYYNGDRWLGHATFFCSVECLQAGPALEDKSHGKGDGVMMEWVGSGGA